MASTIDELVFKLGLNVSDVTKGAAQAKKSMSDVEGQANKTGGAFSSMGNDGNNAFIAVNKSAAVFFATLAGAVALRSFIKQTSDAVASVGRLSSNLGMSVTDVSAWATAAEKVGGSAEGMYNSMKMLSSERWSLQTQGTSRLLPFYSKLGLGTIGDDPAKEILKISDAIQKLNAPVQYKYNFLKQMGFDEGSVNLIMKGSAAITKSVQEARRLAPTAQEVQAAKDLQENMAALDKTFRQLGNQTLPVLNDVLKWLVDINKASEGVAIQVGAAVVAFKALGGSAVISAINSVANALGGLGGALGKLGGGVGLLFHSDKLNQGEAEFLAKNRALARKQGINPLGTPSAKSPSASKPSPVNFADLEKRYGLPAGLLDSMWLQESGRGKNMVSPAGATGHFQFMPKTAASYGMSREHTFDLGKSSESAAKMMSQLMKHYNGDLNKSLAAYNFGMGNIDKGRPWPAETRNYTQQITSRLGQPQNAGNVNNSRSVANHIGEVKVYTQATDAAGIARDMGKSMNYALAGQADYGVTP